MKSGRPCPQSDQRRAMRPRIHRRSAPVIVPARRRAQSFGRRGMHEVSLTAELLAQIQSQRGKLHPFDRLDMRRTAHVVVDLQNGFMEPGAPVEVPVAREIVPNVNSISAAVRRGGGRNVFLRMTVDSGSRSGWSNWFAHMHTPQGGAAVADAFARNAHYWQL